MTHLKRTDDKIQNQEFLTKKKKKNYKKTTGTNKTA